MLASPTFTSSVIKALNLLCEKEGWVYGAGWIISKEKNEATPTNTWYAETEHVNRLADFRKVVESYVIPLDANSIIARVVKTAHPEWIEDISKELEKENEGVKAPLQEAGFKAVFAVPIVHNENVLAVLEFRSFDERTISDETSNYFASVASRVVSAAMEPEPSSDSLGRGVFAEQMDTVFRIIMEEGIFTEAVIRREVDWFYNGLGLDSFYFLHYSPQLISKHILGFIAAKLHSQTTGTAEDIRFKNEEKDSALYICPAGDTIEIERLIESKYLGEGYAGSVQVEKGHGPSVKYFLSGGTASPTSSVKLVLYVVATNKYVNETLAEGETDIWKLATGVFLREKSLRARERYQAVLENAVKTLAPTVIAQKSQTPGEDHVISVAYKAASTHSFFSSMTNLLARYGLQVPRKYIESFSNGYIAYSYHVQGSTEEVVANIVQLANLLWILPRTTLSPLVEAGKLTLPEMVYAYSAWKFAFHFLSRNPEEFSVLWETLGHDSVAKARLLKLKKRIRTDAATEVRCAETVFEHYELIKEFFQDFKHHFEPRKDGSTPPKPTFNNELWAKVQRTVLNGIDMEVLRSFLIFNSQLLKTNFFSQTKTAVSFRFDPSFLASNDVPVIPYAMFTVIGAEFRGFHIRFDEVARGGVRLIRSRNKQVWQRNAETVFDENYNLAWTQQKKNKDIPEGGSKGTILLSTDHQAKAAVAFSKYIDALLDLLLPNGDIVDHYGNEELLFLGPDEGTADLMDWAALHAKKRGYRYWSSFTTGKSTSLGGIPHDVYGMTTSGVHQYVLGLMKKLGIKEEEVTKLQTGGPDGDLGSNEIKISYDKTIAVVDGSGVLCDPVGIDRDELRRLANARIMVENFDKSKLSKDGFLVLLDDKDITLPDGTVVDSGVNFRNNFHLNPLAKADMFVPCGGRPESVNIGNVSNLIVDGKPLFRYVVEGANLFFTQEARIKLEEAGVILFKDASTNKGGVTSSSMEVLSALTLNEEEFKEHMCVKDGVIPQFYNEYVQDVKDRIKSNADVEFECLWREAERTNKPRCVLTDEVSERINELNGHIKDSGLFDNQELTTKLLKEIIPPTLQKLLGLETVVKRLPEAHTRAMLSSYLASRYVYEHGLGPNEFSFFQFMQKYVKN